VTSTRIDVAVSDENAVDDGLLDQWSSSSTALVRLDVLSNEATHRKLMEVLKAVQSYHDGPAYHLLHVLLGLSPPEEASPALPPPLTPIVSQGLNTSQLEAVALALEAKHVALIHGPPGKVNSEGGGGGRGGYE